jgi:hypothetical protein
MSASLRAFIKSAWDLAHPSAPVYVTDPPTPANSFIQTDLYKANLETSRSYPRCILHQIRRTPVFTPSGFIINKYALEIFIMNKHDPNSTEVIRLGILDALRPVVDKFLRYLHENTGGAEDHGHEGIQVPFIVEIAPGTLDDNTCGYVIALNLIWDDTTAYLCEAPELLPEP